MPQGLCREEGSKVRLSLQEEPVRVKGEAGGRISLLIPVLRTSLVVTV